MELLIAILADTLASPRRALILAVTLGVAAGIFAGATGRDDEPAVQP